MKLFVKFALMIVAVMHMVVPGFNSKVEAANIVVMPIINNTEYEEVDSAYYDNVIDVIKNQDKYNMLENDAVTAAINKYTAKGVLPTEEAIKNIANEADADLVVCVELNKINTEEVYGGGMGMKEDKVYLTIMGNSVSYNREINKFNLRKLHVNETYDPAMYTRQNHALRQFSRLMQNDMRRIMNVKGFRVEKQRIQKF